MDKFKTDYHNHSHLSVCASEEMQIDTMVKILEECGVEHAGITDHVYLNLPTDRQYNITKSALDSIETSVKIFIGAEVEMVSPGELIVDPADLGVFNYIMIACTHYQVTDTVTPPLFFDDKTIAQNMYDYMIASAVVELADIIAHPFDVRGLKVYRNDFDLISVMALFKDSDYEAVIRQLKRYEIAIELSARLLNSVYARSVYRFLRLCKNAGLKFSLGSDAHTIDTMCAVPQIKRYLDDLHIGSDDLWTLQ